VLGGGSRGAALEGSDQWETVDTTAGYSDLLGNRTEGSASGGFCVGWSTWKTAQEEAIQPTVPVSALW